MKELSKAKKIVSSDGLNIHYWINWERDFNRDFVVLHPGSSMNHSSLHAIEEGFNKRGNPTLVFDSRGFGCSDAPSDSKFYSLEKYSGDLQKIVEQEGLENPVLLGHSFGFMPIIDYSNKTDNASHVVGICGSYNYSKTTANKVLFHIFNKVLRYTEYLGSIGTDIVHRFKEEERTYVPDQSNLGDKSDFQIWCNIVDVPLSKVTAHIVAALEINKWDITKQLEEAKNPMLLVYGDNDFMVRPSAGYYIKNKTKADCNIEVLEGDHSLPMKKPKEILETIYHYIR